MLSSSPLRFPHVREPAPVADSSPRTRWRWSANSWGLRGWDSPAFLRQMREKLPLAAVLVSLCSNFSAATSLLQRSSRKRRLKTPSPELLQPAAPQTLCCIFWLSPTKRKFPFPLMILTASVRACQSLPISNLEDVLSLPISTRQAALRSSQSACLKLDCSAEMPSPSREALLPKKQPKLRKRRRKKSYANSTRPSSPLAGSSYSSGSTFPKPT